MAGRVALLILTTALFAAAWSSDQEPAAVAASPGVRPYVSEPVLETTMHRWKVSNADALTNSQHEWTPSDDSTAAYLVVDAQGRTERVVLHRRTDDGTAVLLQAEDHFVTEQDGRRRHWIRLSTSRPAGNQ